MKYAGFPKTDPEGPGVVNGAIPLCMHNLVVVLGGGKSGGVGGPSLAEVGHYLSYISAWLLPIFPLSLHPIFQAAENSLHPTPLLSSSAQAHEAKQP